MCNSSGQLFGLMVKVLVTMPAFHIGVLGFDAHLWLLTPASCKCTHWEVAVMAQVVVFLSLTKKTWTEASIVV